MVDYVISGTTDMPLVPTLCSGVKRVAQRLVRRLNSPRGSSCTDKNYGYDVADHVQDTMSVADIARLRAAIKAECEKDDDVSTAFVDLTFDSRTKTLLIRIHAVGPKVTVTFSAAATDAGVELLEAA